MDTGRAGLFGTVIMVVVAGLLVSSWVRFRNRDVEFCRRVFGQFVDGDPSVARSIAWERFAAMGQDVGALYVQLPNEQERSKYRAAFVVQFAEGFRKGNGRAGDLVRWRTQERGRDHAVVAADHAPSHHALLFTVGKRGQRQLEAIRWE